MAHGRPVIATRVGGLVDLRGDGVVHVGPRDVAALRAAIGRLLADPAERARRGAAAAATAAAEFSAPVAAAELVDAYRAALGA
jgi:glycosyltransferase involved in cell wall biosynthesis